MKSIIFLLLVFASLNILANGSFSFIAGGYYYEFNYGYERSATGKVTYEFYKESYLKNTTIWHLRFKSILRIELNGDGRTYKTIKMNQYAEIARIQPNPNESLIAAAVGEHVFILTNDYHVLQAYRNTYFKGWISNDVIAVEVEDGTGGSKYRTSIYTLDISKNTAKKRD